MSWFKKKSEENVEELPRLPDLPEPPDFFQSKNSFDKSMYPKSPPGLPELNKQKQSESSFLPEIEITDYSPSEPLSIDHPGITSRSPLPINDARLKPMKTHEIQKPRVHEIKDYPRSIEMSSPNTHSNPSTKKIEPIYIRLDKFQTTVEAFEEIKHKIAEIEKLLIKTREIKSQEEKELTEWENELQGIKARIDSIDRNIFNKLD